MTTESEISQLIKDYTPVLVLYPEIPAGTSREQEWNGDFQANGKSPLAYDYHPRDVRLVLEHSIFHEWFRWFRRRKNPTTWSGMLGRMERTRYRKNLDVFPNVRREDRGAFWERYASIQKDTNPNYARACYARAVYNSSKTELIVQYWYAYVYNDFWNCHEMDWETVMMVFNVSESGIAPRLCAASAHVRGFKLDWGEVQKTNDHLEPVNNGTHPVIYVAHGSHAGYFNGSGRYFTAPEIVRRAAARLKKEPRKLMDFTTAFGEETAFLVDAAVMPDEANGKWSGEWRWLNHRGRWGSRGDWDLEFGDSGPRGPKFSMLKWIDPFRWVETICESAQPPE